MADTTREFRFRYEGPIEPAPERFCLLCAAVDTGVNHKTAEAKGSDLSSCPVEHIVRRKAAGKPVHCPLHSGLKAALSAHKGEHDTHDASLFDAFCKDIADHVALVAKGRAMVSVHAWGFVDPRNADGTPDLTLPFAKQIIDVTLPRTGDAEAPPRPGPIPGVEPVTVKPKAA